jgi:hypothetical protein
VKSRAALLLAAALPLLLLSRGVRAAETFGVQPSAAVVAPATTATPATSAAASAPVLQPLPGRTGYAFDKPDILLRQRLFGLAHGVSLLSAACVDLPEQSAAVGQAYAAWYAQHAQAIATIVHELGNYYFGDPAAATVQWQDLTRALGLKEDIRLALGGFELSVACATLVQAMTKPRYDLTALLQQEPVAALALIDGVPPPIATSATSATSAKQDAPTESAATAESSAPNGSSPNGSAPNNPAPERTMPATAPAAVPQTDAAAETAVPAVPAASLTSPSPTSIP